MRIEQKTRREFGNCSRDAQIKGSSRPLFDSRAIRCESDISHGKATTASGGLPRIYCRSRDQQRKNWQRGRSQGGRAAAGGRVWLTEGWCRSSWILQDAPSNIPRTWKKSSARDGAAEHQGKYTDCMRPVCNISESEREKERAAVSVSKGWLAHCCCCCAGDTYQVERVYTLTAAYWSAAGAADAPSATPESAHKRKIMCHSLSCTHSPAARVYVFVCRAT